MQAMILAGGSGTRFWPLSRRHRPKQLLALEGERSLLQDTVHRLSPLISPAQVWVCTTKRLADAVREQLPEVPAEQILVEPEGRNTAPAIGWSVTRMPPELRRGVVAVLPADHRFADAAVFRETLSLAAEAAEQDDRVMTLGVTPRRADTGYGYLELGSVLNPSIGLAEVARFREKPDLETAQQYAASGKHLWNAGIFVFRGDTLLSHLRALAPEIATGLDAITAQPQRTAELYAQLPSISIDYAVMEHLSDLATLPLDCGWSDLGTWEALAEVLPKQEHDNRLIGDVLALDASRNLVVADHGTVALVGVEGLVVVKTDDAVLVMPKERSQEVKRVTEALAKQGREDRL